MGDVEFVDPPAPDGADDDDVLDTTSRRRLPRWAVPLAVVALAAGALMIVTNRGSPRHAAGPAPTPATTASATTAGVTIPPAPTALPDTNLFAVYARTHDSTPTQDYVRSGSNPGSCAQVAIGTRPKRRAEQALLRQLSGYAPIDSSAIIDQDAGLCALEVRAQDGHGTVVVLTVISPTEVPGGRNLLRVDDGTVVGTPVEYVQFRTGTGWLVMVGASGPRDRLPATRDLTTVAVDAAVRW